MPVLGGLLQPMAQTQKQQRCNQAFNELIVERAGYAKYSTLYQETEKKKCHRVSVCKMTRVQRRERFTQFNKGKASWKRWYLSLGFERWFWIPGRTQGTKRYRGREIWLRISKQTFDCSAVVGGKRVEAVKISGCNDKK